MVTGRKNKRVIRRLVYNFQYFEPALAASRLTVVYRKGHMIM